MNILLRIILAVYALCMAVVSMVVMLMSLRKEVAELLIDKLNTNIYLALDPLPRIIMFTAALLFFVLSLVFVFVRTRAKKDKKGVIKMTNSGEVNISLNTIENIAVNTAKKIEGVKSTKITLKQQDAGVAIVLKHIVMPDISIPLLTEEVQSAVKKAVEEGAGVEVKSIKVLIDSIYEPTASEKSATSAERPAEPKQIQ